MYNKVAVILISALLPVACGQVSNLDKTIASAQSAISSDEQAANQIYLDDVDDSAADSSSTDASTATTSTDSSTTSTTTASTTADDIQDKRLDEMVAMVFKDLDADSSGSLTLDEFLVGPKKRADDQAVDADVKAKMVAQMTADFNTYAGSDALLSQDELKTLLKAMAPRVDRHRCGKDGSGKPQDQAARVKETAADIIKKFDTDGDGKLSEAEVQAMQDAQAAEHKEWREKNEPGMDGGSQDGQGPDDDKEQGQSGPGGAGQGHGHH